MAMPLTIYCAITAENGNRVPMTISDPNCSPTDLRLQVSQATKIPLAQLRLIFRGKMIKDDPSANVIKDYKLESDCVLHCMGKPNKQVAEQAPTSNIATTSAPSISVAAPAAAAATSIQPPADPLTQALELLRTNAASPDVYQTAVTTLDKILSNMVQNPMEEKYRKVKVHNAAFQKRLGGLVGGRQAMLGAGFVETTDESGTLIYLLTPSPEAWPNLQKAKTQVELAAKAAKRSTATHTTLPNENNASLFGAGTAPGAGMGGLPQNPAATAAAANLLSNPQALQGMLQNPMVQQMMQNDPNIPPHVRQAMQQLSQNPQMMNQLSQMMSDPMMRSQLQAALQANGGAGLGGMGGPAGLGNMMGGGGMPNLTNTNTNASTNNNNSDGNDQDQTEEEMIAEAIRRSLEEG